MESENIVRKNADQRRDLPSEINCPLEAVKNIIIRKEGERDIQICYRPKHMRSSQRDRLSGEQIFWPKQVKTISERELNNDW